MLFAKQKARPFFYLMKIYQKKLRVAHFLRTDGGDGLPIV